MAGDNLLKALDEWAKGQESLKQKIKVVVSTTSGNVVFGWLDPDAGEGQQLVLNDWQSTAPKKLFNYRAPRAHVVWAPEPGQYGPAIFEHAGEFIVMIGTVVSQQLFFQMLSDSWIDGGWPDTFVSQYVHQSDEVAEHYLYLAGASLLHQPELDANMAAATQSKSPLALDHNRINCCGDVF